jgi:hypothetical protein
MQVSDKIAGLFDTFRENQAAIENMKLQLKQKTHLKLANQKLLDEKKQKLSQVEQESCSLRKVRYILTPCLEYNN